MILSDTARDVQSGKTMGGYGDEATPGFDDATGAGFVDAFEACLKVEQLQGTVPP